MQAHVFVIVFLIIIVIAILVIREMLNGALRNEIFRPNKVPLTYSSSLVSDNLYIGDIRISHTKCVNPKFDKYIFYFHGRYGNMYMYKDLTQLLHSTDRNVILMDYRGYGKSTGETDVRSILSDSLTLTNYYINKYNIPLENITVWGESLGSIPAIYIASVLNIDSLVVYGGISSISDIINYKQDMYYVSIVYGMLSLYDYSNIPNLRKCRANKVIFVHSKDDELINYSCCITSYRECASVNKKMIKLSGTHAKPVFAVKDIKAIFGSINVENKCHKDMCLKLNRVIQQL